MSTADDFNQLVRPVVWRNENSEYPFWGRGCLCMMAYRSHWLLVTAKHITDGTNLDNLCIRARDDLNFILPLKMLYTPLSHDNFDTDHLDLSILEVDQSKISGKDIQGVELLHFEAVYCSPAELVSDSKLLALGMPKLEFDYDGKILNMVRYQCHGAYKGVAPYKGCHEMNFDPNQEQNVQSEPGVKMKLPTLDGFSGGPVYVEIAGKMPRLVGMALRGSIESRKLYFLGSDLIKELLDRVTSV